MELGRIDYNDVTQRRIKISFEDWPQARETEYLQICIKSPKNKGNVYHEQIIPDQNPSFLLLPLSTSSVAPPVSCTLGDRVGWNWVC